jgi:sulfate adenylyltransferase subunit 2
MDYLDQLESEAIYILRETAAQFARPAILFSGGKDSACVWHLARKAFAPARHPFPLLHVDTGHNFPETISYRDELARTAGDRLHVGLVEQTIRNGRASDPSGPEASRNAIQSITLLDTIEELKLDAVIGGARRDEEKARAKERVFSVRDEFGQWDPRNQRPELWIQLNGRLRRGEHMRVFPLSNWTRSRFPRSTTPTAARSCARETGCCSRPATRSGRSTARGSRSSTCAAAPSVT